MKCYVTVMSVFPTPMIQQSLVSSNISHKLACRAGQEYFRPWVGFVSYQQNKTSYGQRNLVAYQWDFPLLHRWRQSINE